MSFRDKFSWSPKLNGRWPPEKLVASNAGANLEMQKAVKSMFEQGIERLSRSHLTSSAELQAEVAYQSERLGREITGQIQQSSREIVGAVEQGAFDIVDSIQRMSAYLGAELCEVRWAVERHTKVSQGILQVLLQSQDNKSRQYYEQGVKCYEASEYDFAKERFDKALEANRTNHFAYQYLGFVAVTNDNPDEAIRNFDLARKFADKGYHQALALSHLARSHFAKGDLSKAAELAGAATEAHSESANFWYESAAYHVHLGRTQPALSALQEAIERDWTYYVVAASDPVFDSIRPEVDSLLHGLRGREKAKALRSLENLKRAIEMGITFGVQEKIARQVASIDVLIEKFKRNNIYLYREITTEATKQHDAIFVTAAAELEKRLPIAQSQLTASNRKWHDALSDLRRSYGKPSGSRRESELWYLIQYGKNYSSHRSQQPPSKDRDEARWLAELSLTEVFAGSFITCAAAALSAFYGSGKYSEWPFYSADFWAALTSPVFLAVTLGVSAVIALLILLAAAMMSRREKNYLRRKENFNQAYERETKKLQGEIAELKNHIELSKKKQYAKPSPAS